MMANELMVLSFIMILPIIIIHRDEQRYVQVKTFFVKMYKFLVPGFFLVQDSVKSILIATLACAAFAFWFTFWDTHEDRILELFGLRNVSFYDLLVGRTQPLHMGAFTRLPRPEPGIEQPNVQLRPIQTLLSPGLASRINYETQQNGNTVLHSGPGIARNSPRSPINNDGND
jgi:hypothetical protein